ncbi:hypothetical protein C0J52_10127 [Blattella germanica]|nr:hypothetical protein C0J52_10127 [Blattella germanica]
MNHPVDIFRPLDSRVTRNGQTLKSLLASSDSNAVSPTTEVSDTSALVLRAMADLIIARGNVSGDEPRIAGGSHRFDYTGLDI